MISFTEEKRRKNETKSDTIKRLDEELQYRNKKNEERVLDNRFEGVYAEISRKIKLVYRDLAEFRSEVSEVKDSLFWFKLVAVLSLVLSIIAVF